MLRFASVAENLLLSWQEHDDCLACIESGFDLGGSMVDLLFDLKR
jgi:hypothetical protein